MKNSLLLTFTLCLVLAGFSTVWAQERAVGLTSEAPDTPKGYVGIAEIGYLYGATHNSGFSYSIASPTVQLFNGYRFHRLLAVGGTVGFDFYDNVLVTPLALGLRGELFNSRISPVYGLDVGYGSGFLSDEGSERKIEGGFMFSPSAGIRVRTGNSTAFTFGMGYKSQRVKTDTSWWGNRTEQKINYKRLSLRMGFMF